MFVLHLNIKAKNQARLNKRLIVEKWRQEQGLTILNVYKDIERYRVKNKLVDPSGTRSDRPGLLAMLRDAAQGDFGVILAWREG